MKNSEESTPLRAYQYALRLLAARDYTVSRLQGKLGLKGFDAADAENALQRLIAEGWLNDRRFAERFAESAMASGRYYGYRLRQEMRRRGLSPELVTTVLAEVTQDRDEDQDMLEVFQRRFSGFSFNSASDKEKRRVIGYFMRRGVTYPEVMRMLKQTEE